MSSVNKDQYNKRNLNLPSHPSQARLQSIKREKVALAPGHSALDWAHLTATRPTHELRGLSEGSPNPFLIRVTKGQLAEHNQYHDCWTAINGRVYNITHYIDFHPGGKEEIMKCAGRDGTSLFNKYHSWVNAERLLGRCMIGFFKP